MKPNILALFAVLLLTWSSLSAAVPTLAQNPDITYQRYDVEIQLKPNGDFTVREIQQVQFNGAFRTAFAEIPLAYTLGIDNIQLWVDEMPYTPRSGSPTGAGTYAVSQDDQNLYVDWRYAETQPGDVRTFTLQYDVHGGLWVYPDEMVLEWRAVPADRSGFPVLASQVTVILPDQVAAGELRYEAYGPAFAAEVGDSQVTWTATEMIGDGTHFQVRLGFPAGLVAASVQPWQVAEDTARLAYRLAAIDVNLAIEADGRVRVLEEQQVIVEAGAMHEGHRSFDLAALDGITNVNVFEGEQRFSPDSENCETYCFRVEEIARSALWARYDDDRRAVIVDDTQAGRVDLRWLFPGLVRGEATTFRLEYEAVGAIHNQRLDWAVVFEGHDVPVERAALEITLPPGIGWEEVRVEGADLQHGPDGAGRLVAAGPIPPGQPWQISLILPAGATAASKPAWQQQLEAAQAEARQAEIRRARLQLGAGAGAALVLVGGLLAVLLAWRQWGQDRQAIAAVDYLSQPPSDLPPGIVAYLVDEKPTAKGVLASLFQLASLGLLRLDMSTPWLGLERNWREELAEGQAIQTAAGDVVTIPGHLVTLFNALRPHIHADKSVALSAIATEFQAALPGVYLDMASEASHLFTGRPDTVRHRWLVRGQWLVLAALGLAVVAWLFYVSDIGWISLAPAVALAGVGLVLMLASRWMPQRTTVGAEEAARWRAFQRYLRQLQAYGNQAEAQAVLDRYFAYAVALDADEAVLAQAEALGAAMPAWTFPARLEAAPELPSSGQASEETRRQSSRQNARPTRPLRVVRQQPAQSEATTATNQPAPARPSLQGLSSQLGQTLAGASESVGSVLNAAVASSQDDTPFKLILKGSGATAEFTWKATTTTLEVIGDILEVMDSLSGSGSGGYSSGSSGWSSRSSGSSSSGWSSSSSSRSSSSRRSGGGGRRGFG